MVFLGIRYGENTLPAKNFGEFSLDEKTLGNKYRSFLAGY